MVPCRKASSLSLKEKVSGLKGVGVARRTTASVGIATWKNILENALV